MYQKAGERVIMDLLMRFVTFSTWHFAEMASDVPVVSHYLGSKLVVPAFAPS